MSPFGVKERVLQFGLGFSVILGTFGNSMTLVVLRTMPPASTGHSTSLLFGALAVFDLINVWAGAFPFWLLYVTGVSLTELHPLVCKLDNFLIYVFGMTSSWLLVTLTLQRVVAVTWPHRVAVLFTKQRAWAAVMVIVFFMMALNAHILAVFTVKDLFSEDTECSQIAARPGGAETATSNSSAEYNSPVHSRSSSGVSWANSSAARAGLDWDEIRGDYNGSFNAWNLSSPAGTSATRCVNVTRKTGIMCGWKPVRDELVRYDHFVYPWIDMVMTSFLPSLIIAVSNAILGCTMFRTANAARAMMATKPAVPAAPAAPAAATAVAGGSGISVIQAASSSPQDGSAAAAAATKTKTNSKPKPKTKKTAAPSTEKKEELPAVVKARQKAASSVTRMVMSASLSFLVLTLPVHGYLIEFRLFTVDDPVRKEWQELGFAIVNVMWTFNSSLNFYIYILTGSRFRAQFKRLLRLDQ